MSGQAFILELLLRGLAVGALAALAAGLWRSDVSRPVRWAALLVCLGVAGYATAMCGMIREALGPARWIAIVFGYGVSAYVWQFVLVVFEDRRVSPTTLAPIALLTASGLFAVFGPIAGAREAAAIARDLLAIGLSVHALVIVLSTWRGDLVEARRRLRGPFFAVVSGYIVVQTAVDAMIRRGAVMPWRDLVNAAALALLALLAAAVFLGARQGLFGPPRRPREAPDAGAELARLRTAMNETELWRQEGLTIAALARAVGTPEHRLRRLINDDLGHRNFASFVNAYRIDAARRALADPARAQDTIAALAYQLGFGSLGPFNRAFRAAAGETPREWRRRALARLETLAESSKLG